MARQKNIIVLDRSSSVGHLSRDIVKMFNDLVSTFKTEAKKNKVLTDLTTITFSSVVDNLIHNEVKIDKVQPLTRLECWGNTALFDAIGTAIEKCMNSDDIEDKDTAFLIIVVTDGEENWSGKYANVTNLNAAISKALNTSRISIVVQVPRGGKDRLVRMGIPADNIREWEQTSYGVTEMEQKTSGGISLYYSERAKGVTQTRGFFQTDLSNVTKRDLRNLDDLSRKFNDFKVNSQAVIKPFVEGRTGVPYVQGNAYYQLMKTEKLQAGKLILIQDKTSKKIYGGDEARTLLGLDIGIEVKVVPGNHANYDIFIQSTSVNRILPRGTRVLVKA